MTAASKTNSVLDVTLHSAVSTLPGTGGASVSAWAIATDYMPRFAVLRITNGGAAALTLGSHDSPVTLLANGVPVGVLFDGREAVIDAAGTIWAFAPVDAGALGQTWSVSAAVSSASSVNVTVVARPLVTTDDAIAGQVWDKVRADHATAGTFGAAAQQIVPTATQIVTALLATVLETYESESYTVHALWLRLHAFIAGHASVPGATEGNYIFRALDGTTSRIAATILSGVRTITGRGP